VAASRSRSSRRTRLPAAERLARLAARVVGWERGARVRVAVTLLDAPSMRRLNRRSTGRRGLTDVIAYTLSQPDGQVLGDVYVCPAAAVRNARAHPDAGGPQEELVRLVVHGTLHVLGYDHPAGVRRARSPMWRRQERYVRRLLGSRSR
jgi:probable rRNA maturation factor